MNIMKRKSKQQFWSKEYLPVWGLWGACATVGFIIALCSGGIDSITDAIKAGLLDVGIFSVVALVHHFLLWLADKIGGPNLKSEDFNNFFFD